uniref:2-methoxy-6-polyprenyl-1,4-benzoquinol methylase, mitochondrial n=1 Tax=Setaria digitata TaxID=48799 RepID=A0A915Q3E4_9BILA
MVGINGRLWLTVLSGKIPRYHAMEPLDGTSVRYATTHFGFQEVDEKDKSKKVHAVFASVADKYDLMNDAMSVGIHRLWKDQFVRNLGLTANTLMVDVAGGTGDIAFRAVREIQAKKGTGSVTVCDINENMLRVGQQRAVADPSVLKARLKWVCGDAEALPFDSNSFDIYTIAFGIRNCTNIDRVLKEAYRVLRPEGKFACLEFSHINSLLKPFYDFYSFQIIPVLGQVIAGDFYSYRYLVESIRKFPDQIKYQEMIEKAGFKDVKYDNLSCGICAIHTGLKSGSCFEIVAEFGSEEGAGRMVELIRLREGNRNVFLKDLGRLTVMQTDDEPYTPGVCQNLQACFFSDDDPVVITHKSLFYQVLVHCGDWKNMHFPVDITSYLEDSGTIHGEKVLTVVFGMDCVPHDEIIPYRTHITRPIAHNLFRDLFECTAVEDNDLIFSVRKEPSFLISQHSNSVLNQLKPHFAYRETTDGIRVTVITFYLGLNTVSGQQKHWWRYVIRLENLRPCPIIIRSREMKVYSLSNMQQQKMPNIAGGITVKVKFTLLAKKLTNWNSEIIEKAKSERNFYQNPRLTPEEPAFQYSGMVGVVVDKGSYAWGNFTMEREEDRTSFLVKVPTFRLECDPNPAPEKTERLS